MPGIVFIIGKNVTRKVAIITPVEDGDKKMFGVGKVDLPLDVFGGIELKKVVEDPDLPYFSNGRFVSCWSDTEIVEALSELLENPDGNDPEELDDLRKKVAEIRRVFVIAA